MKEPVILIRWRMGLRPEAQGVSSVAVDKLGGSEKRFYGHLIAKTISCSTAIGASLDQKDENYRFRASQEDRRPCCPALPK
jgi:hypothetical protein